jgi:hypothetical protein
MDSDRRRHPRIPMEVEVEVHVEGEPLRVGHTMDLSGGGLLVILPESECPPPGTSIQVRVVGALGDGEEPPLVPGRVVRHMGDGVAVEFDSSDGPG